MKREKHTEKKKKSFNIQEVKRLFHETIKGRITMSVLALVIIPLALLGIISSVLNNHSTNSTLKRNMTATAKVAAERVEWEMTSYRNLAEDLGMTARLAREDASLEEKQEIIDERVEVNGLIRGNILDKNGISIFSGEDFSDREYFKTAMEGHSCVSQPIVSKTTGKLSIIIAAPIWEGGVFGTQVVGVVYLVPEETFLNDIMAATSVSENGYSYMINEEGTVIAHENMELVEKGENSIKDAENDSSLKVLANLEKKMIAGETGAGTYRYGGVRKIMAYAPVENSGGWSIAITAPLSDFNIETIVGIILTVVIVIVSIVLAGNIVKKLADSIGTRIRLCAERLTKLAKGDLHSDIPDFEAADETKALAEATRVIVEEIGEMIADIKYLLGEMAVNNFDVHSRAADSYVGDFEEILLAVRRINHSLSGTLGHIRESADQVGLGSSQMAESGQALAEGATDQAASIEKLLATVNNLAEQVERNTKNAVSTSRKADDIGKQAKAGNEHIVEMTQAMGKISDASLEIANIIQTIEAIADQTSLLSLNASIEAARAGEVGRGFAVVAGEIGHLATQSAEAVEDTRSLIEAAVSEVESGNKIAEETAQALQTIISGIAEIVKAVEEVAENSSQQNGAMQQINQAIEQISEVVQSNSAAAEESSATSQELSAQAIELNDMIEQFNLADL